MLQQRSVNKSGSVHCRDHYWSFSQQNWENPMWNKTCTVEGVICTVCYCSGLIKNCLKTFLVRLPMCGRQPLVALCLLMMKMQCQSLHWPQCLPACSSVMNGLIASSFCEIDHMTLHLYVCVCVLNFYFAYLSLRHRTIFYIGTLLILMACVCVCVRARAGVCMCVCAQVCVCAFGGCFVSANGLLVDVCQCCCLLMFVCLPLSRHFPCKTW